MESKGYTDIGNLAMWSVSSYKLGFGVDSLRVDDPTKLWQSDGPQPHYVDIHFSKKVSVGQISLFFNHLVDESYTPSKIRILAGDGYHSLLQVTTIDLAEPTGWSNVSFDTVRSEYVTFSEKLDTNILTIL